MRLAVVSSLLVLAGCPGSGSGGAEGAEGTTGDEAIMFPDEAEQAERERNAPPATEPVERAEALLAQGEAREALALLEQAVADDPSDPRAQLDLGLTHELLGDAAAAERAYRAAIDAAPEFPEPYNNLGLLLRELERFDEAVEQLRAAIRLRPDFASAHVNLALALEERGDLEEAADAYREAMRHAPRDPMSRINLGLLLIRLDRADQAAIELRRAMPLSRGNAAALAAVGNGLRRVGQGEAAVRAMTLAIEARGEEGPTPALLSELALAQRAAGDREAAEATLRRVLELDPRFATAHYLLGNLLAGRGEFREAIQHYQRYLRAEPSGPHAEMARERMGVARRQL